MSKQFRQGDVFVESVDSIPAEAKKVPAEQGLCILARGEATGHHHSVDAQRAVLMLLGTVMYLRVLKETQLRHQEHGSIPLKPGDYIVRRQRTYTPERILNVAD